MKIHRIAIILFAAALALTGCSGAMTGITERTAAPDTSPVPVPPLGGDVAPEQVPVTLYFQYRTENLLAPCAVLLDVTNDKTLEQAALERLVAGTDVGAGNEYAALIPPGTSIAVQERPGHLEVTVSKEYVDAMTSLPDPWNITSEDYEMQLMARKHLALYSIVNTITEMGRYSRVLVMVDHGTGVSEKMRRSEAGLDLSERTIDPMERDVSMVLTPHRCARIALDALSREDMPRLAAMIAPRDVDGAQAPHADELAGLLLGRYTLIDDYVIAADITVMPASMLSQASYEQVTLSVDVTFLDNNGNVRPTEKVPLRLVRSGAIWKMAYSSLEAMVPES